MDPDPLRVSCSSSPARCCRGYAPAGSVGARIATGRARQVTARSRPERACLNDLHRTLRAGTRPRPHAQAAPVPQHRTADDDVHSPVWWWSASRRTAPMVHQHGLPQDQLPVEASGQRRAAGRRVPATCSSSNATPDPRRGTILGKSVRITCNGGAVTWRIADIPLAPRPRRRR